MKRKQPLSKLYTCISNLPGTIFVSLLSNKVKVLEFCFIETYNFIVRINNMFLQIKAYIICSFVILTYVIQPEINLYAMIDVY
jgi:hypothetical protein